MAIKTLKQQKLTWVNIDSMDQEALSFLKTNYNFHQLDFEDLQSESQTPKIDSYKNYLFIVLQFPQWKQSAQIVVPHEIDIFIGDNYLITIQHNRSKEMKNFFYRCMKNKNIKKEWMSGSSGHLLYKLIEALFRNTQPVLNQMGKQLYEVEEQIFSGDHDPKLVRQLGVHRRNVLHYRRILDPQRYLISTLSHTRRDFLEESLSLYFDDITDYLNKLWAIINTYRDTVEGLHVTVESLINHRTNKVIGALTIISVSLLPLTLLSGIYGMNISGLPFAQEPAYVWLIFLILGLFIFFVIFMMRKKRWI